jgi:uncharacterized protein (TIGR03435 family)
MFRLVQRYIGLFAALLVFPCSPYLHAQAPIVEEPNYTPTLTFDVATIRLAPPPDANFHVSVSSPPHSSHFEATNLPIKALLQIAYGFDAPVVGAPDWVANTFYDIRARSDEATDARLARLTDNEVRLEKRNAIRVLLAERLGLKTHLETRNTSIYNLVVDKGGVRMQVVPPPPPPANGEAPPPPRPADVQAHGSQHGLEFVGSNASMRAITGALSSMVEAPVVDKTGLTGSYNYTLQLAAHGPKAIRKAGPRFSPRCKNSLGSSSKLYTSPCPTLWSTTSRSQRKTESLNESCAMPHPSHA